MSVLLLAKKIGEKAARKMLVKLTIQEEGVVGQGQGVLLVTISP